MGGGIGCCAGVGGCHFVGVEGGKVFVWIFRMKSAGGLMGWRRSFGAFCVAKCQLEKGWGKEGVSCKKVRFILNNICRECFSGGQSPFFGG